MALRYAILGMLTLGEHTGYDLSKRFNGSVGFFWSAKHSQIYPELAKLLEEGLIACQAIEQDGKPNKKVYTVSDSGREALRDWLAEPTEATVVKDPMLLKTFCVSGGDREGLASQLEENLHVTSERLYIYQELERGMQAQGETEPSHPWFGSYLTLRYAMMQASATIAWSEWAIEQLRPGCGLPRP